VVPFKVMMFDEFGERPAQRSFSEQNEFGQALLPDRAHPALRESIQVRTLGRKGQWPYPARLQGIQKGGAELRIPIVKKAP